MNIREMPITRITATEASRNFSDILNRAQYRGECFEVVRGGEVVAVIRPEVRKLMTLGEIFDRLDRLPGLDPDDAGQFEAQISELRREANLPDTQWD